MTIRVCVLLIGVWVGMGQVEASSKGVIYVSKIEQVAFSSSFSTIGRVYWDENNWAFRASVTDKEVMRIGRGDRGDIVLDAIPEGVFEAKITHVSNRSNPRTGMFDISFEVANKVRDFKFKEGLLGQVRVYPSSQKNMMYSAIPIEAVTAFKGKRGVVFCFRKKKIEQVTINIAFVKEGKVYVYEALDHYDKVLISRMDSPHIGYLNSRDVEIVKVDIKNDD